MLNDNAKRIIDLKLKSLSKSKFRSSFKLHKKEIDYIRKNGLAKVRFHAYIFVRDKLALAVILNDGAQTPMKNHPVFIAQHATGTCCRGCLEKWHKIPKGRALTQSEQNYIVELIMAWIEMNYEKTQ